MLVLSDYHILIFSNPQTTAPRDLYLEAAQLYQRGDFPQAENKLQKALRAQPRFPEATYLLARVCAATQRPQDAEKLVQEALNQKPDFAEAWHLLGRLFLSRKDFSKAKDAFLKTTQLNPKNTFVFLDLGNALESLEDNEGALKAYTNAIEAAGENDKARVRAQTSLGLLHIKFASIYSDKNEIQRSVQELEKARDYLTPSAEFYGLLGAAYLKVNDPRAVQTLTRAVEMNPTDEDWEKLGKTLSKLQKFDEAVNLFEAKSKENPNLAAFHLLLGAAYWDKTEYGKALDEYRKAISLDPRSVRGHYLLGSSYKLMGDSAASIKSFEQALNLDPEFKPAQVAMVDILAEEGKRLEAIALLERVVAKNKQDAEVQLKLGQLYLETSQFERCLKTLEEAKRLAPEAKKVHYLLGRLYTAQNQPDLARKEFDLFSSLETTEMDRKRQIK